MPSPALQVELDLFRGPLHTLLDLIERRELPVTRVSLVEVAYQFLAVLELVRRRHLTMRQQSNFGPIELVVEGEG